MTIKRNKEIKRINLNNCGLHMLTHLLKMNSIHISKLENEHIPSGGKNVGKKKKIETNTHVDGKGQKFSITC
jgi:hypothetical protein